MNEVMFSCFHGLKLKLLLFKLKVSAIFRRFLCEFVIILYFICCRLLLDQPQLKNKNYDLNNEQIVNP